MKPFLLGKKAIDAAPLQTAQAHVHHPAASAGQVRPAPGGPHVEVVKQGDKVVRLVVTCSCGERIEVECLYPGGS